MEHVDDAILLRIPRPRLWGFPGSFAFTVLSAGGFDPPRRPFRLVVGLIILGLTQFPLGPFRGLGLIALRPVRYLLQAPVSILHLTEAFQQSRAASARRLAKLICRAPSPLAAAC
jgi:hypothetical protein